MAALLRQAARRIGVHRTQAPAVAEERRRLLTTAPQPTRTPYQEYLEKKYGRLKWHHFCWELIKLFPAGKAFGLVAMTTGTYAFVTAAREVRLEMEEAEKKKAQKKREQSASKWQEAKKREH